MPPWITCKNALNETEANDNNNIKKKCTIGRESINVIEHTPVRMDVKAK